MRCRLVCVALALPAVAQAQATVRGQVVDSAGRPLANAEVLITNPARSVRTDSAGQFVIDGLAAGAYDVRARRLGFYLGETKVTLPANATKTLRFELYERPQVLKAVDVTATCVRWEFEGFACRQAKGGRGILMDEVAIDSKHALMIGELFQGIPGLRVEGDYVSSLVGWRCMTTVVNGKVPNRTTNPGPHWPSDLIGIELYLNPDSVPSEYSQFVWGRTGGKHSSPARCSVLIMWTSGRPRYTPGTRKK